MEDGVIATGDEGTPQGAVISPLLANIYLHYASIYGSSNGGDAMPRRHDRGAIR